MLKDEETVGVCVSCLYLTQTRTHVHISEMAATGIGLVGILIVVHIADMPVEAVFAFYLVRAHRARKLRLNSAFVTLVLNESTASRIAPATARTHVWFILNQGS